VPAGLLSAKAIPKTGVTDFRVSKMSNYCQRDRIPMECFFVDYPVWAKNTEASDLEGM
jgi:hypothetical protein